MTAPTLADAVAAIDDRFDGAVDAIVAADQSAAGDAAGDRYVLVSLASTCYAVLEAYVTEIDRVPRITPVPHVPVWVRGVTSVRGDIFSVVDMRAFLGLDAQPLRTARLLVVRLLTEEFSAGLLVEGVDRIVDIAADAIGAPESPLEGPLAPFLNGICTIGDRTVAVLDLDRLLRSPEIRQFEERKEDPSCEER